MATSTETTTATKETITFIIKGQAIEFIQLTQNPTQQEICLLTGKIYMSECGRFMILSRGDDKIILFPKYTHLGAFGRIGVDRKKINIQEGNIISEKGEHTHWLVLKIPSDLANIIDLPKDLYIQVGTYNLHTDDGKKGPPATKLRKVTQTNAHLHQLNIHPSDIHPSDTKYAMVTNTKYAMVSSSILIEGGLQGNPTHLITIARILQKKYTLDVFSCHCQHHALVFRQTPHELSITLREQPEIVQELVLLAPSYEKERIEKWAAAYIQEFQ